MAPPPPPRRVCIAGSGDQQLPESDTTGPPGDVRSPGGGLPHSVTTRDVRCLHSVHPDPGVICPCPPHLVFPKTKAFVSVFTPQSPNLWCEHHPYQNPVGLQGALNGGLQAASQSEAGEKGGTKDLLPLRTTDPREAWAWPSELDASIHAGCWGDSSEQVWGVPLDKRGDRRRRASRGGQALGAAESDRETGLCWVQARLLDAVTGRGGEEAVTLFLAEGAAMRGLAVSSGGAGKGGAGWGPGHAGSWARLRERGSRGRCLSTEAPWSHQHWLPYEETSVTLGKPVLGTSAGLWGLTWPGPCPSLP